MLIDRVKCLFLYFSFLLFSIAIVENFVKESGNYSAEYINFTLYRTYHNAMVNIFFFTVKRKKKRESLNCGHSQHAVSFSQMSKVHGRCISFYIFLLIACGAEK